MELLGIIRCVEYARLDPPVPAINVVVKEPLYGRTKSFKAPLDTGFAGYLMLPDSDYLEFSTAEAPREQFGAYTTMAGPVVMRRARVRIGVGETELESFIETPVHGGGKLLLGRRILNQLDVALMGAQERACLVVPQRARTDHVSST